MKEITIYTDGSVYPNPNGMGGWAYVAFGLRPGDEEKPAEHYAWQQKTTNNRMELLAAIQGISNCVGRGQFAVIVTDSQYVQRCLARKRWPDSKPNADLGRFLAEVRNGRFLEVKLVPGHSGDRYNDRAHELANKARLEGLEWLKRRAQEEAQFQAQIERDRAARGTVRSGSSTDALWIDLPPQPLTPSCLPMFHRGRRRVRRADEPTPTPANTASGYTLEW